MLPANDARTLSHLFHLNSEPWLGPETWESLEDRVDHDASDGVTPSAIALPPRDDTPFSGLLQRRASCREFMDRPLAARHLGSLLWCGYGVARTAMVPELTLYRTVPSAGALYPLELFALTRRVDTLEDALYRYDTVAHELRPREMTGVASDLWGDALLSQTFARHANAIVFIVSVFDRSQRKYGPRGYRYVLLEAGHVAQNICLCAAERGLASLCLGGYGDAKLNALLGLDTRRVGVVYAVAVGYAVAHV
jgi:SagB-type dehydrogenase family enzyme